MNSQTNLLHDMASELAPPVSAGDVPATRLRHRVAGLAVLATVAALVALGTRSLYYVVTDSWVAPIHLSPQNDAVLQLQVKLARERAEMARVEADLERIDGDLAAVDAAVARLS